MTYIAPIFVGILYACLMSLIREPHRRRFNAVSLRPQLFAGLRDLRSGDRDVVPARRSALDAC